MFHRQRLPFAVAAAALLALPALAQPNNGSSMQPQATQTMPQQGMVSGQPGAAAGATAGGSGNPQSGVVQGGQGGLPIRPAAPDRVPTPNMPPQGRPGAPAMQPGTTPGTAPRMNAPAPAAPERLLFAQSTLGNRTPDTAVPAATTPGLAVDAAALRNGHRASRVIGSAVYNEANDSIGEVDDLLIPAAGGAAVAVVSVGGFLGIGAKLVAVPYARLQLNTERNRWVLPGATRDGLNALPTFAYEAESRRG